MLAMRAILAVLGFSKSLNGDSHRDLAPDSSATALSSTIWCTLSVEIKGKVSSKLITTTRMILINSIGLGQTVFGRKPFRRRKTKKDD